MLHERKSMLAEGRVDTSSPDGDLAPLRGRAARVGGELRATRLQYGWDLEAVAASLRIRSAYLQAIEAGRVADLPGKAYALGFLRTYATMLGLDADEMCRRFRAEVAELNAETELTFPAPVPQRGVPAGAVILLGVVVAIGAYAGWYHWAEQVPSGHATIPVPPELARLAEPSALAPKAIEAASPASRAAPGLAPQSLGAIAGMPEGPSSRAANPPDSVAGAGSAQASSATVPGAPPVDTTVVAPSRAATGVAVAQASGLPGAASAMAAKSPVAAMSASSDDAGSAAGTNGATAASTLTPGHLASERPAGSGAPPAAAAGSALAAVAALAPPAQAATPATGTVIVRATAESWIEVKDANGAIIFTKLMQPGETWTAPQEPGLTLTTGNAGGTQLVVDGKVSAPLGAPGEVERNQPLDAGLIKAGALPAQIAAAAAPSGGHPILRTTP